jgi:hypothetical protein
MKAGGSIGCFAIWEKFALRNLDPKFIAEATSGKDLAVVLRHKMNEVSDLITYCLS